MYETDLDFALPAGIFIVFDYRGQLREEEEREQERSRKSIPYGY